MSRQRMLVSRRFALATAALVLGLSSCGDPSTSSGRSPAVIQLAAAGGSGAVAASEADTRMMVPWGEIDYVFSGAFPQLPDAGGAWYFPAGAEPNVDRLAAMAQQLGVDGAVVELPADQGGGWMMGAPDYTTSSLWVSADAMLSWWYNPDPAMWQTTSVSCGVVEPASGGESSGDSTVPAPEPAPAPEPVCPEPTPPVGVPTSDAAVASARALFSGLGYDASAYEWTVYADQWSANVTGTMILDGARSPITLSVGYGAEGAITWAGGSLATPQRGDDYPLVGPQVGLDRLNDDAGGWMGYGINPAAISSRGGGVAMADQTVSAGSSSPAVGAPDVAPPPDSSAEPTPVDPALVDPATSVDPVLIDPATPIEPMPPVTCDSSGDCPAPEPITVTLTGVGLDTTMVWAADGTVWLLPAYSFTSADGGAYTVIAVDDSFIQLPEPLPVPEPMPLPLPEPMPTDTAVDGSGSGGTVVVGGDVVVPAPVDQAVAAELLVGLSEDAASALATEQGWSLRVTERDGVSLPATADFSPTRVNVAVESGVVVGITAIG